MASKTEDPRHTTRAEDLAKQAEQETAMQAFYVQQAADAKAALERQAYKEVHGVTLVEGKP